MAQLIIGKSGERQTGAISMQTEYKVAQIATDTDGNWWYSRKSGNQGHTLPTTFAGVGTANEWWICVFDAKTYKASLAAYAQDLIDANNTRATTAVEAAEEALATAQAALRTTADVQAAIDAAEAAAALANASVSLATDAQVDALWEGYDFRELVDPLRKNNSDTDNENE